MKLISSVMLFVFAWSFIALAQVAPSASPVVAVVAQSAAPVIAAAPAIVPVSGIMGWIAAHGGFQGAVLILVSSFLALLSAIRQVLYNFDGVAPGAPIPVDKSALTLVNKICLILGQVVDFMSGNTKH